MSDDLVKRLESGIATKAQIMGGFTFDIPATQTLLAEAAAEIARLRAQVAAGDKLAEAVAGLVSILDQNETKGPISDVQLMFCWLAAQDVRAAAKGAKAK